MTMVTALESLDGTKDVLTSVDLRNALYEVDYEGVTGISASTITAMPSAIRLI